MIVYYIFCRFFFILKIFKSYNIKCQHYVAVLFDYHSDPDAVEYSRIKISDLFDW